MLSHVRGSPKRWFKPRPVTSGLSKLRTCPLFSQTVAKGHVWTAPGLEEESSLCSVDVPEAELGYRAATTQERTHDD